MRSSLQIVLLLLSTFSVGAFDAAAQSDPVLTGNDACRACHVTHEQHQRNIYHSDCQVCHTATQDHMQEGGRDNITFPDSGRCLTCHEYNDHQRMNWMFSEHAKAGVECRQCHANHSPKVSQLRPDLVRTDEDSVLCMQCHQDVAARMHLTSHHPVREGALSCTSCHDPHNAVQTSLMGLNERCTRCHQNVRGPKVFEHAPVVEDCVICHDPHGSPNRRLLQLAQPMQCLQCHTMAANVHGSLATLNRAQMRNCTNCHSAIHGSHSDPILKY